MKSLNKRINRKKTSKVTLKTHRKHSRHGGVRDEAKEVSEGVSAVRPEDIKLHQHY